MVLVIVKPPSMCSILICFWLLTRRWRVEGYARLMQCDWTKLQQPATHTEKWHSIDGAQAPSWAVWCGLPGVWQSHLWDIKIGDSWYVRTWCTSYVAGSNQNVKSAVWIPHLRRSLQFGAEMTHTRHFTACHPFGWDKLSFTGCVDSWSFVIQVLHIGQFGRSCSRYVSKPAHGAGHLMAQIWLPLRDMLPQTESSDCLLAMKRNTVAVKMSGVCVLIKSFCQEGAKRQTFVNHRPNFMLWSILIPRAVNWQFKIDRTLEPKMYQFPMLA